MIVCDLTFITNFNHYGDPNNKILNQNIIDFLSHHKKNNLALNFKTLSVAEGLADLPNFSSSKTPRTL